MRREHVSSVPEPGEHPTIAFRPAPSTPTSAHPSSRRNVFIVVSVIALCLLLLGGGFLIYSATRPDVDTPSSFTASLLDVGWELHTSKNGDFTLALPPSWSRYTKAIPMNGPNLKFAAWGFSVEEHQEAWLYVFKWPVRSGQEAQTFFEQLRVRIRSDPAVVRLSELREIEVPDGIIYTLTSVAIRSPSGTAAIRSPSGRPRSETLYGILHG
ncbi:MAG: hypothetical protein ACREXY_20425, partial [Gammaproteobacteria bacterium]